MKKEKRSNIGYEIIESLVVKSTEIVIGHSPNQPNPYVCWYCNNSRDYYWGFYCNDLESSRKKMLERYEYEMKH